MRGRRKTLAKEEMVEEGTAEILESLKEMAEQLVEICLESFVCYNGIVGLLEEET